MLSFKKVTTVLILIVYAMYGYRVQISSKQEISAT